MSKIIRSSLRMLAPLVSIKQLIHLTDRKILLPFYHSVTAVPLPHITHLYQNRSIQQFHEDLDFLCKHYRCISIEELHQIVRENKSIGKPVFHLTFDDGLSEFYSIVAPILTSRGITATVFLNSAFIDNHDLFFRYKASLLIDQLTATADLKPYNEALDLNLRSVSQVKQAILNISYDQRGKLDTLTQKLSISFHDYLEKHRPYLQTREILELMNQGFTFGSHSVDHPIFGDLSLNEQKRQIEDSFIELHDKFQFENNYFSFPFNDLGVSKHLIEWLHDDQQCNLSFGISGLKDDVIPYHLHRLPMEGSDKSAQDLIKTEYLYYMAKSLVNKNSIIRS